MSDTPKPKEQKVDLRLPAGMRDKLNEYARGQGRSANTQIVQFIDAGMNGPSPAVMASAILEIREALDEIRQQLKSLTL